MKQKLNFAILVVENVMFILWPLKWRHLVAKFIIFHARNAKFLSLSHAEKVFLDILNILGVVRYRSF